MIARWHGLPTRGDPRLAVAAILLAYVVTGIAVLGFNRSPLQVAITVGTAVVLDALFHRLMRPGAPALFPFSALVTGLSLSILVNYAHGPWLSAVPVFFAIASKHLLTYDGRHVYNPALFGVVASLAIGGGMLSDSPAYQWGGSLSAAAFVVTLGLMLFVLKVQRTVLVVSFLLFYLAALAARAWLLRWHLPAETWFMGPLTSPAFYLFTFFMITDPRTSPPGRRGQVLVAACIVLIDFLLQMHQQLSTLFIAAFACATLRFVGMHARALVTAGRARWTVLATRLRALPRRLAVIGSAVALGLAGQQTFLAAGEHEPPGFRLVNVDAAGAGITSRPGRVLENVDPRVAHVAKWVLSVGDAVAVGDVDGDGLPDLFLTYPLKDPRDRAALYRNLGGLRFERIPLPALDDFVSDEKKHGLPSGALFLDYDNDGDQDLLVLAGYGRPRLLRNMLVEEGRLRFVDATPEHDLPPYTISLAASAVDIDGDGRLDLVIGNAMNPWLPDYTPPRRLNIFALPEAAFPGDRRMFNFMHRTWHDAANGGGVMLAMNRGGRYAQSDAAAFGFTEQRWTIAIGSGDLDGDGRTDLYLANDFGPDQLLLNRGGTRFEAVRGSMPGEIGRDTYKGMNASIADLDGDGLPDIYVSNVHERLQAEGSLLWRNLGGGRFVDVAMRRNALNERRFGWGAAVGDLDRDGRLDIVQANGMVDNSLDPLYPGCPDYWYWNDKVALTPPDVHGYADRWADLRGRCIFPHELDRVYLNRGRHFVDVAKQVGWNRPGNSRGIALVDLDNDGDLDVVVTHQFAAVSIHRNDGPPRAWVGLALEGNGRSCNRDAIGTRVELVHEIHGTKQVQVREVQSANGFSAQSDRRLLFGLGETAGKVTASIRWCGSATVQATTLEPGVYRRVRQPD